MSKIESSPFSIRTKILMAMIGLPTLGLTLLLVFLFYSFEKDKMAYVYETLSLTTLNHAQQLDSNLAAMKETTTDLIKYAPLQGSLWAPETKRLFLENRFVDGLFVAHLGQGHSTLEKPGIQILHILTKNQSVVTAMEQQPAGEYLTVIGTSSNLGFLLLIKSTKTLAWAYSHSAGLVKHIFRPSIYLHGLLDAKSQLLIGTDDPSESGALKQLIGAFSRITKNASNKEGVGRYKLAKNEDYFVAVRTLKSFNLAFLSMISKSDSMTVLSKLLNDATLFFIILISLGIFLGTLLTDSITAPLSKLFFATKQIAAGDFDIQLRIKNKDEVGLLAKSFNLMAIEIRHLLRETEEKSRMENELKTAQLVQTTFFPKDFVQLEGVSIAGRFEPATECSGDWWYHFQQGSKVYFMIGDATGHGVSAALVTSAVCSIVATLQDEAFQMDSLLKKINQALYSLFGEKIMMTFFIGEYDQAHRKLSFANASHEVPLLFRSALDTIQRNDIIPLQEVRSPRLGENPEASFEVHEMTLEPGDRLFLYTDGIFELRDRTGAILKERNLYQMLVTIHNQKLPLPKALSALFDNLGAYERGTVPDDFTVLFIETSHRL